MIRDFDSWFNNVGEGAELQQFRGTRIAIEAADYIRAHIIAYPHATEPLVPALGGLPLGYKESIEDNLQRFASYEIEPFFVFSGLDLAKREDPFRQRQEAVFVHQFAWQLYDNHQAEESVKRFGESTYITPEDLFPALQSVLTEHKLGFLVAPYSAWAQLAYLERHKKVHAIAGSSETLLFGCDKLITAWDFEQGMVKYVSRNNCIADLKGFTGNGDITDDQFVDACFLAGSQFLATMPLLDTPQRRALLKPHAAIEMIVNGGRSGMSVVLSNKDDPSLKNIDYVDKYQRARLSVKHHPVLTKEGRVEPNDEHLLPSDAHEIIGQQLPDEIYYYLSRGLINARILNWRATGEIVEVPPTDGGENTEYQQLVSSKLIPLRTIAINLLSSSLHNWYQHKDLTLKCWFHVSKDQPYTSTISMKNMPDWKTIVATWNVREETFKPALSQYTGRGLLGTAILALKNADFVAQSSSKKEVGKPLTTPDEVVYNSIWRFLTLREYVDINHELTAWGKVLATIITALNGNAELEEAAVLAVELLRLGVLNTDNMFDQYNGAPIRGEQKDRDFNLLVSRVAGLGTLHHKPVGFTGPLSRHLLGYNSMINAVRSTVRDLVEVSVTHLLLGGFAQRDLDISKMAARLPFLLPINSALSIAVKTYLDELTGQSDPTTIEAKGQVMYRVSAGYFPQSTDFVDDIDTAFHLWNAVYEGVNSSGNLLKGDEKKVWSEVKEWLTPRR